MRSPQNHHHHRSLLHAKKHRRQMIRQETCRSESKCHPVLMMMILILEI
jgi:hypothetical protein